MNAMAPERVKISVQYRTKHGKIYELTNKETVLALHILPPHGEVDSDDWHVEARLGTGVGPSVADGWGSTAAEALRETGRAWVSREGTVFDWEAVTRELKGVSAV
jgi:hypothetical protein